MTKKVRLRVGIVTISDENFEPIRHLCTCFGSNNWHPRRGQGDNIEKYVKSLASGENVDDILEILSGFKVSTKVSDVVKSEI